MLNKDNARTMLALENAIGVTHVTAGSVLTVMRYTCATLAGGRTAGTVVTVKTVRSGEYKV